MRVRALSRGSARPAGSYEKMLFDESFTCIVRLFIATADAKEMADGVAILMAAHKPDSLAIQVDPMPGEHHNTIFPVAALKAFRALFAVDAR